MYDSYWSVPEDLSDISHYGVKGMKWGVRKSEYKSMSRRDRRKLRKRKNEAYSDHQGDLDKVIAGTAAAIKFGAIALTKLQLAPSASKWHDFAEATAKNRIGSVGYNGPNVVNVTATNIRERRRRF